MNITSNVYYIHDDCSAEMVCGNNIVLLDRKFVKIVSIYQWSVGRHGYVVSGAGKNQILLHRLIIKAKNGESVDHINHNKLDNRITNLRIVTNQQNSVNRTKQINNASGYKGVCRLPDGTWQAQIGYNGNSIYLGKFPNAISAAQSYDTAAKTLFGEYAYLNDTEVSNQENAEILKKVNKPRKKLTEEQATQIRSLYNEGLTINELSYMFNHCYSSINRIVNNKTFNKNRRSQ